MTISAIENLESCLTECNRLNYCADALSEVKAHIDAQAAEISKLDAELEKEGDLLVDAMEKNRDQAARIAEHQAVINQRNGECDRLINELAALADVAGSNAARVKKLETELAALREQKPVGYISELVDSGRFKGDATGGVLIEEGMTLYSDPVPAAPIVVPEKVFDITEANKHTAGNAYELDAWVRGANWMRTEVLRLNSGSKTDGD